MRISPNVCSLFSGVGGICLGFSSAGFNIVVANEIDINAIRTYRMNFATTLIEGDIALNVDAVCKHDFDIIVAGFPCQPFSVAGKRKGIDDPRGRIIDFVFQIIQIKKPKIIFLENVFGLLSSNNGEDFKWIRSMLEKNYYLAYKVICPYSIGYSYQKRKRLYIVATLNNRFEFKEISKEKITPEQYEWDDNDQLEYTPEKYRRLFENIPEIMEIEHGYFYQIRRVYLRKLRCCPTLTANMGTGGHNVPIIRTNSNKIRRLSPRECFNLMGFPEWFRLPKIGNCHLYKQAGNSVIVPLIERLAFDLYQFYQQNYS